MIIWNAAGFGESGFDKAETMMDTSERLVWQCETMVTQRRTTCKLQKSIRIKEKS